MPKPKANCNSGKRSFTWATKAVDNICYFSRKPYGKLYFATWQQDRHHTKNNRQSNIHTIKQKNV